jgi:hypothetical protein
MATLLAGPATVNPFLRRQGQNAQLQSSLRSILQDYPALRGQPWSVGYGDKAKYGGALEFFPPDESENPRSGKAYVEVYDRDRPTLKNDIFGDMLHYLPRVDPNFADMRKQYAASRTPAQERMDREAYAMDQRDYGESRPFDQWFDQSRLDAHVRGKLARQWPDNIYTPQQNDILQRMQDYLRTPK